MKKKKFINRPGAVKNIRYAHSKKRAKERYDMNLTKADAERIVKLIYDQRSKPIHYISKSKKVHLVHYNNKDIIVIYCKKSKAIVTLLPKEHKYYQDYLESKQNEP